MMTPLEPAGAEAMAAGTAATAVHFIPILTTLLSIGFFVILFRHARRAGFPPHLVWWTIGVATYGLGTGLESAITLSGNTVTLNKVWYIAGALLGGYPLAQGTVHLLLRPRTASILTWLTAPLIAALAIVTLASPARVDALDPLRPSGAILEWSWIRLMTPIINGYAAFFLIGGAMLSSWRYARTRNAPGRAIGNALIALGAILPGVGGGMAKAGVVEALYIGEFIGIILIWIGYTICVRRPSPDRPPAAPPLEC